MKKLRNILFIIGILSAAFLSISTYAKLPEKVEKIESKQEETEDDIQKLAVTFDKYLMRQETLEEAQERREELLLKLLER